MTCDGIKWLFGGIPPGQAIFITAIECWTLICPLVIVVFICQWLNSALIFIFLVCCTDWHDGGNMPQARVAFCIEPF